ncbi:ABC transporter permease [candidate division CSSED10-310 bacterium]|uniref:ABC transporter permease n=1 Tax=candidate division CSSED10-310 bacterium TaxID=2855610 RepID=A0ABV6YS03_UNCC1
MSSFIFLLKLGFKNIFRNKLRSGLALAAIALSIALIIVGMTFIKGAHTQLFQELLNEYGHLVLANENYFEKSRFNPLDYSIENADQLLAELKSIKEIITSIKIIEFGFLIDKDEQNEPVRVTGVDVDEFKKFSRLSQCIIEGRYLKAEAKEILLGKIIAEKLHVKAGDEITAVGKTVHDSFYADGYTVVGIFDLGARFLNKAAYISIHQAQIFLDMENQVSKILLFGKSYLGAPRLKKKIQENIALPANIKVRTWQEDPLIGMMSKTFMAVMSSILFIICFVAGLGILNMMFVSVLERKKEIAVLLALGMNHYRVMLLFLYEAFCYGSLGSIIGCILGTGPAIMLATKGITLNFEKIQGISFPLRETIYGDFQPINILVAMTIGILVSIAGMVWPILKIFRFKPNEVMRH